jgi:hypothetical protein
MTRTRFAAMPSLNGGQPRQCVQEDRPDPHRRDKPQHVAARPDHSHRITCDARSHGVIRSLMIRSISIRQRFVEGSMNSSRGRRNFSTGKKQRSPCSLPARGLSTPIPPSRE